MTAAPEPVLRYRRRVDDPPTPLRAPRVQTPSRPQDPQTPPRGTSRGLESDLARAGKVLRDQTRNEYHRRRSDAQENHAAHRNTETSSAVAQAQAGVGNRFGAGDQIPPRGCLHRYCVETLFSSWAFPHQTLSVTVSAPFRNCLLRRRRRLATTLLPEDIGLRWRP